MFYRILVLPQGGEPKQAAIERAALCASPSTEIVVTDVVYEPMLEGYLGNKAVYEPLRRRVLAERQERAAALAATLEARGFEAFGNAVWERQREDAVEKYVRDKHADLVVTAPFDGGRGGLSSSDWRLVSKCPAPVLIAKSPGTEQYRHIVAAVDPFHAHAKPASLDAAILATAAKLQAQTRATLTVLHCFAPPEFFRADPRLEARDDEVQRSRRETLEALLRDAGIATSAARVVPGEPHAELQAMAERGEADVIVMGALARGRVRDWLIGSTAERVLTRGDVDVVAVNLAR